MRLKKDTSKGYKIRNKYSKLYWTGDYRSDYCEIKGATWSSMVRLETDLSRYIKYSNKKANKNELIIPSEWEIVEVELKEEVKSTSSPIELFRHIFIKKELEPKGYKMSFFYERMINLGIANQIEFMIELRPTTGKRWIDMDCIKTARAHLRLLGVKTRTFRERQGVFGMMNREQAMKARLVLDVADVVDLAEIRDKINNNMK